MTCSPAYLRSATLAIVGTLVLLSSAGCNEEVPPTSADGMVFTLWGQLDPTTERQAVRVEPISPTLDGVEALDATVVSVDLQSGAETTWRDSVITFPDGSVGHVFLADVRPSYGSPVEFRVLRDGEVATYARVQVPPRVTGYFGDPIIGARSTVDLVLPGAPRVVDARVVYDLDTGGGDFTETVPVEQANIQSVDFGWRVRVDFTRQVALLRNRFFQRDIRDVSAEVIRVQAAVTNEEWAAPFPFEFSRGLLLQPGTVSNVRNGFGFLGAAYTVDLVWEVDEEVLRRIGL